MKGLLVQKAFFPLLKAVEQRAQTEQEEGVVRDVILQALQGTNSKPVLTKAKVQPCYLKNGRKIFLLSKC